MFARFGLIHQIVLPIPALMAALIICVSLIVPDVVQNSVEENAQETALNTLEQYKILRGYYARHVVSKVRKNSGMEAAANHRGFDNRIPLPATMIHDLSTEIERELGISLKVISPYPFPERANRELTRFQSEAWANINQNPQAIEKRVEKVGDQVLMRIAVADRMRTQECVDCHNQHSSSPKTDWKLGDVRGILQLQTDISGQLHLANRIALLIVASLVVLGGLTTLIFYLRARRIVNPIEDVTTAMNKLRVGNYDIDMGGNPISREVHKMAVAVRFFRNALMERDQLRRREREAVDLQFHLVVEASGSVIVQLDQSGIITFCNPAIEKILRYRKDEVLGKHITLLFPDGKDDDGGRGNINLLLDHVTDKSTVTARDGSALPVDVSVNETTLGGQPQYTLIIRDISARKSEERKLLQAQKLEAVGQLAGGIAHEINTPIQYVGDNLRFLLESHDDIDRLLNSAMTLARKSQSDPLLAAEALAVEALSEEIDLEFLAGETKSALQQSLEGISHVASIVSAMKEFSHPGLKEVASIDINRALHNTVTVCGNEWKYVATVDFDLDPDLPSVLGMPSAINQVFLNLITNAAHAIAELKNDQLGQIRISTRSLADKVEIRISDTGTGIARENQDKIFELFFTTKDVGKGTGQGLPMSREIIVVKHHGTLNFESEVGEGTTFIITLPVIKKRDRKAPGCRKD